MEYPAAHDAGDLVTEVSVTFTETVTRTLTFDLEFEEGIDLAEIDSCGDIHEMLDRQHGWDQPTSDQWLTGDIEERVVDGFEIAGRDAVIG